MNYDIIRRIAERGLKRAQEQATPPPYPEYESTEDRWTRNMHSSYMDLFQHILDELERINEL